MHYAAAASGYPAAESYNTEITRLQAAGADWNSAPEPAIPKSTAAVTKPVHDSDGSEHPIATVVLAPSEPAEQVSSIRSIDDLKEALIQQLQIGHTMLATVVDKTLNWYEQDGTLYMSVHTPFEVRQLQQERPVLTQKIATLYGKTLAIHIGLVQEAVKTPPIPARVEMVLHMIKGRIVDIQKKRIPEASEEDE